MTAKEMMEKLEALADKGTRMSGYFLNVEVWSFNLPALRDLIESFEKKQGSVGWTPEKVTMALLATDGRYESKQDQAVKLIELIEGDANA